MASLKHRFPTYRKLLWLYPKPYREAYGEQMLQTLSDMLDDAASYRQRIVVFARLALDFPFSVMRQQLSYAGGIMKNDTSDYVKRNSIIGAVLLVPFFIFILINTLSNHAFANSAEWNRFLFALLVGLPALAFLLNAATFIKWVFERKSSPWRSLIDFHHNWPMVVTAGLGLLIMVFVLYHDSVHCVTGNPIREIRQVHQTWWCIEQR